MRTRRRITLAAAAVVGLSIAAALVRRHNSPGVPLLPGPARRQAQAEAKLRVVLPRVRFESTSVEKAFQDLQAMSGAKFVVDWDAIEASIGNVRRDDPVTLSLTDVTLEQALNALVGYVYRTIDYTLFDGAIVVTTDNAAGNYVYAAVYDLRGLHLQRPWVPPPDEYRGLFLFSPEPPPFVDLDDELTRLVEETVSPDQWLDAGGTVGTVRTFNGRVVAVTTWRNHRRIEALVSELRSSSR
jgi:hypothetical protein